MSDIPNSLTQCMDPQSMSVQDFFTKGTDLAKATGMDEKCVKAANSSGMNLSMSMDVNVPFASAAAQASMAAYTRSMTESGCGQFAQNLSNQMNAMKDINCSIKNTQSNVNVNQVAGNSLQLESIPLEPFEAAALEKLQQALINLDQLQITILANPNITKERLDILLKLNESNKKTYQSLIKNYDRSININNSQLNQSVVQRQAGSIDITNINVDDIVKNQKIIATATAQNKLQQDLGVDALTPE